jgi:hypothetical protein
MSVLPYLLSECLFLLQDSHLHALPVHVLVMLDATLLSFCVLISLSVS